MLLEIVVATLIILLCVVGGVYYKYRVLTRLKAPKDVVILYQVGRGPLAPSISPFPLKLETFLRMMHIPYMNDHLGRFSSKGKTPWIECNGAPIADSQLAIEFLKKKLDLDPDKHLSEVDQAVGRAFLKLTEENLYWTMCIEMFGDNLEAVKTVIPYRGFKLWFTVKLLRRVIAKETWGHGIGRHSNDEVWDIAVKDMTAISQFLGSKRYFLGDQPSEVDCAMFGMLSMINWNMPGSRHQTYLKEHLPNLIDYVNRMKDTFWPDWESRTRRGKSYTDDHGKLYSGDCVSQLSNGSAATTAATD